MTFAKGHMSVVCKHFSSETTGPISFKFHSSKGGKKVYIFGPGQLTKMAAMPIYGKNLKNLFTEPLGRLPRNLVRSILGISPLKFI